MIRAYLDNNATTRLLPAAFKAMTPYLTGEFLNPSSAASQVLGAGDPAHDAKLALGRLMGSADLADQFVLTSGASEANSWAVFAAIQHRADAHIVTTAIEHSALLAAAAAAAERGARVDRVGCDTSGRVNASDIAIVLKPDTVLVSVMMANNETGVVQPVGEIADTVRQIAPAALIHVDATQCLGRIPIDLTEGLREIDLLSLSAHKFHGPKGIGALFVRSGLEIPSMIHGTQEEGRRGGTVNAAGAAGLAAAAEHARRSLLRADDVAAMRDHLEASLLSACPHVRFNGAAAHRLPNTSSITLRGLNADEAVEALARRGICVASGSACSSGSQAPSHVLTAMGLGYDDAKATLRLSLSTESRWEEIDLALYEIVELARSLAPRLASSPA